MPASWAAMFFFVGRHIFCVLGLHDGHRFFVGRHAFLVLGLELHGAFRGPLIHQAQPVVDQDALRQGL